MDPVLQGHLGPGYGGVGTPPPLAAEESYMQGVTDRRVPNYLAAAVVGSVVTLVALRAAGFRFSFGASVGGGS